MARKGDDEARRIAEWLNLGVHWSRTSDEAFQRRDRRRKRRIALVELLEERGRRVPWAYFVTQTYTPGLWSRGWRPRHVLEWTLRMWRLLPTWVRPSYVFAAVEPHKSGLPHVHSLWASSGSVGNGSWRVVKRFLEPVGFARVRPFVSGVGGEAYAVKEAALYTTKGRTCWSMEVFS